MTTYTNLKGNSGVTQIIAGTGTAVNTSTGIVTISVTSQGFNASSTGTTSTFVVTNTATSTGTDTGALTVAGGAGIGGDLNVGGSITSNSSTVITTSSIASYTTLQAVTNQGSSTTNALLISSTASSNSTTTGALVVAGGVGIGGDLNVSGQLTVSGAVVLTTASAFDVGVLVIEPGTDIAVNTTTGYVIISNISTLQSVTDRGSTTDNVVTLTNTTPSLNTVSGALVVAGGLGVGGNVNFGGDLTVGGTVNVGTITHNNTATFNQSILHQGTLLETLVTSANTTATTIIDSFNADLYRSCRSVVQIEDGGLTGSDQNYQLTEMVLLMDQNGNIYKSEYGIFSTSGTEIGNFSADYDTLTHSIRLFFTAYTATNKIVVVSKTAMPRFDSSGVY